jgi:hypothetical protein
MEDYRMKILAGLALAAFMMVGNASALTYYVVGTCGTFQNNNDVQGSVVTGTWTCPTAASLGITGSLTVASEFVNYTSDWATATSNNVNFNTQYTFTGATLAFANDTVTSTCVSTGCSNGSAGPVSTDGLSLNPLTNNPNGWQTGGTVLAGFYDAVSSFGTITVNYTNTDVSGAALSASGYAQVVYDYNVTSSTPEPISMFLLGGGLLGVSLLGRRKFARK